MKKMFNPVQSYLDDLKNYLAATPITVVYEIASPYYELISEEPLELTLLDTTDNTINNNSILPSNMTIANKELSTIAIKPSTIYTLSFDKSIEDSEVTIDICGGEQITTVLNRVELTTPSELGSGIRFISSDGCIVSNVRLLEGSLVESAIPKESFEGLQSSFDDGYIIGENLATESYCRLDVTRTDIDLAGNMISLTRKVLAGETLTFIAKSKTTSNMLRLSGYSDTANGSGGFGINECGLINGILIGKATPNIDIIKVSIVTHDNTKLSVGDWGEISDLVVLEGDHTHLSEAELMRYIEKGTSHYEEEDYNHVGKYKVQYKVTGKNKFDMEADIIDIVNANISNNDNGILTITPIDKTKNIAIDIAVKIQKGTYFYTGVATDATQFRKDNMILYN